MLLTQVFQDMMKLPDWQIISGPSHSRASNIFRITFNGFPMGRRFYFNMNRPLFRDAVVVIDAPMTYTYEDIKEWINKVFKKYIVRLNPHKWEYIYYSDNYAYRDYGNYNCLENSRNNKIIFDYYFKIKGNYQGQPPLIKFKKQ